MGIGVTELEVNFYAILRDTSNRVEQKSFQFEDGLAHLENGKLIFDGKMDLSDLNDDISAGEVSYHGEAVERSDYIELKLDIIAPFEASCARCAVEINDKISTSVTLKLTDTDESDDNDFDFNDDSFAVLRDGICDVSELVRTVLLVNLPMRFLCSEDCKGLCPKCGANLNEKSCGCTLKEVDPRLSKLKDYLEKLKNNTDEEVE